MTQAQVIDEEATERNQLVKLVRKWGDVNADGLLEEDCYAYSIPEIDGFVGYKLEPSHAVVFGDPVCAPENKPLLAKAFQTYCQTNNLGVVYTIVSQEFAEWGSSKEGLEGVALEFGKNYVLNPMQNPVNNTGSKAVLVRKKVKHALNEGVVVHEYLGDDKAIEDEIEQVAMSWLQKREGIQVYLSHITLFNDRIGKRWFYAKQKDRIVGFALLNQIEVKQGWLLNNLMMVKDAPKGLSELLVIATLQALEKENCHFVLAGPVPAQELGNIIGLGPLGSSFVRWCFKTAKYVLKLEGHEAFWEKFQPIIEKSYLLFPKKNLSFSSIKALLKAFNVGAGKT